MTNLPHERQDNLEAAKDSFKEAGHNLKEAGQSAKESFKEAGHNLKEAGQILTHETRERVDHAVCEVKKHSADLQVAVNNYVRANPMRAMGWALLAGTAFGFLLRK